MAVVCREFGISRETGYKILTRYNAIGLDGLTDRSRRPYRHANQLPIQIGTRIVHLKQDNSVSAHIQTAIGYLNVTSSGRQWIATLYIAMFSARNVS
jgi:leucine-zipper of insertion element IS481